MCEILPQKSSEFPIGEMDSSGNIVKRVSVPPGVEVLLTELSLEVLKTQPKDIYLFAANYFEHLLYIRNKILRGNENTEINAPIEYLKNVRKRLDDESKVINVDSNREEDVPVKALEIVERTLENNVNQISSVASKLTTAFGKLYFETAGQITDESNKEEINGDSKINLTNSTLEEKALSHESTHEQMVEKDEENENLSSTKDETHEETENDQEAEQNENSPILSSNLSELQKPQECDDSEFNNMDNNATTDQQNDTESPTEEPNNVDQLLLVQAVNENEMDPYLQNNDLEKPSNDIIEKNISLIDQNVENIVNVEVISKDSNNYINDTNNACNENNNGNNKMMDLIPDQLKDIQSSGTVDNSLVLENDKPEFRTDESNEKIEIENKLSEDQPELHMKGGNFEKVPLVSTVEAALLNQFNSSNTDSEQIVLQNENKLIDNPNLLEVIEIRNEVTETKETGENLPMESNENQGKTENDETENLDENNVAIENEILELENRDEIKEVTNNEDKLLENSDQVQQRIEMESSDENSKTIANQVIETEKLGETNEADENEIKSLDNFEESLENSDDTTKENEILDTVENKSSEVEILGEVQEKIESKESNNIVIGKVQPNLEETTDIESFQGDLSTNKDSGIKLAPTESLSIELVRSDSVEKFKHNQDLIEKEKIDAEKSIESKDPTGLQETDNDSSNEKISMVEEFPNNAEADYLISISIDMVDTDSNKQYISDSEKELDENQFLIENEVKAIENSIDSQEKTEDDDNNDKKKTIESKIEVIFEKMADITIETINTLGTDSSNEEKVDDTDSKEMLVENQDLIVSDKIEAEISIDIDNVEDNSTDTGKDEVDIVKNTNHNDSETVEVVTKSSAEIDTQITSDLENTDLVQNQETIQKHDDNIENLTKVENMDETFQDELDSANGTDKNLSSIEPVESPDKVDEKESDLNEKVSEDLNENQGIEENNEDTKKIETSSENETPGILEKTTDKITETSQSGLDQIDVLMAKSMNTNESDNYKEPLSDLDKISKNSTNLIEKEKLATEISNDNQDTTEAEKSENNISDKVNEKLDNVTDSVINTFQQGLDTLTNMVDKTETSGEKELATNLDEKHNESHDLIEYEKLEIEKSTENQKTTEEDKNDDTKSNDNSSVKEQMIIDGEISTNLEESSSEIQLNVLEKEEIESTAESTFDTNEDQNMSQNLIENEKNEAEKSNETQNNLEFAENIQNKSETIFEKSEDILAETFQEALDSSVENIVTSSSNLEEDNESGSGQVLPNLEEKSGQNQELEEFAELENSMESIETQNLTSIENNDNKIGDKIEKKFEEVADTVIDTFQKGLNAVDRLVTSSSDNTEVEKAQLSEETQEEIDFESSPNSFGEKIQKKIEDNMIENIVTISRNKEETPSNNQVDESQEIETNIEKHDDTIGDVIQEKLEAAADNMIDTFQKGLNAVDRFITPSSDTTNAEKAQQPVSDSNEMLEESQEVPSIESSDDSIGAKIHKKLEDISDTMTEVFQEGLDSMENLMTSSSNKEENVVNNEIQSEIKEISKENQESDKNENNDLEKSNESQKIKNNGNGDDSIGGIVQENLEEVADDMIDAFQKGLDAVDKFLSPSSDKIEAEKVQQSELNVSEKFEESQESTDIESSNSSIGEKIHKNLNDISDTMINVFQKGLDSVEDLVTSSSSKDEKISGKEIADGADGKFKNNQEFDKKENIDSETLTEIQVATEKNDKKIGDTVQEKLEVVADSMIETFQKGLNAVDKLVSSSPHKGSTASETDIEKEIIASKESNDNQDTNSTENSNSNFSGKIQEKLEIVADNMIDQFQEGLNAVEKLVSSSPDISKADHLTTDLDEKAEESKEETDVKNSNESIGDKIYRKLNDASDTMIETFQEGLDSLENIVTNASNKEEEEFNNDQVSSELSEKSGNNKKIEEHIIIDSGESADKDTTSIEKSDNNIGGIIQEKLETVADSMIDKFQKGLNVVEKLVSASPEKAEEEHNMVPDSNETLDESQKEADFENSKESNGDKIYRKLNDASDTMIETFQEGLDSIGNIISNASNKDDEEFNNDQISPQLSEKSGNHQKLEVHIIIDSDESVENQDTTNNEKTDNNIGSLIQGKLEKVADTMIDQFQKGLNTVEKLVSASPGKEEAEHMVLDSSEELDESQKGTDVKNSNESIGDKIYRKLNEASDTMIETFQGGLDSIGNIVANESNKEEKEFNDDQVSSELSEKSGNNQTLEENKIIDSDESAESQDSTTIEKPSNNIGGIIQNKLETVADSMIDQFQKGLNVVEKLVSKSPEKAEGEHMVPDSSEALDESQKETDFENSKMSIGDKIYRKLNDASDTMIETFQDGIDSLEELITNSSNKEEKDSKNLNMSELDEQIRESQENNGSREPTGNQDAPDFEKDGDSIGDKIHDKLEVVADSMIDAFQKGLNAVDKLVTPSSDKEEAEKSQQLNDLDDTQDTEDEIKKSNDIVEDSVQEKVEKIADTTIDTFQKELDSVTDLISSLPNSDKVSTSGELTTDMNETSDENQDFHQEIGKSNSRESSAEKENSNKNLANKINTKLEKVANTMDETFQKDLNTLDGVTSSSNESDSNVNIDQSKDNIETEEFADFGEKVHKKIENVADNLIEVFQKGLDTVDDFVTSSHEGKQEDDSTKLQLNKRSVDSPEDFIANENFEEEKSNITENISDPKEATEGVGDKIIVKLEEAADTMIDTFQKGLDAVDGLVTSFSEKEEAKSTQQNESNSEKQLTENPEEIDTKEASISTGSKIHADLENLADTMAETFQKGLDKVDDLVSNTFDENLQTTTEIEEDAKIETLQSRINSVDSLVQTTLDNKELDSSKETLYDVEEMLTEKENSNKNGQIEMITDSKNETGSEHNDAGIGNKINSNLGKMADTMIGTFQKGLNVIDGVFTNSSDKGKLTKTTHIDSDSNEILETNPEIINETKQGFDNGNKTEKNDLGNTTIEDQHLETSENKGASEENNFSKSHSRLKRSVNVEISDESFENNDNYHLTVPDSNKHPKSAPSFASSKMSLVDTYKINKLFQYADIIDEKDIKDVAMELIENEKAGETDEFSKCPLVVLNGKIATTLFLVIERAKEENSRMISGWQQLRFGDSYDNRNVNYFSSPFTSVDTVIDGKLKFPSNSPRELENLQDRGSRNSIPLLSEADSNDLSLSESQFNVQSHESGFSSRFSTSQESIIEQKLTEFENEKLSELDSIEETVVFFDSTTENNIILFDSKENKIQNNTFSEGLTEVISVTDKVIIDKNDQSSKKLMKALSSQQLLSTQKPLIKKSMSDASILFERSIHQLENFDISNILVSESIETESEPDIFISNLDEEVPDEDITANNSDEIVERKKVVKSKTQSNLNLEKEKYFKKMKSEGFIVPPEDIALFKLETQFDESEKYVDITTEDTEKTKHADGIIELVLDEGFGEDENEKDNKKDVSLNISDDYNKTSTNLDLEAAKDEKLLDEKNIFKNSKTRERRKSPSNLYETSFLNRTIDYVEEKEKHLQPKSGFQNRDVENSNNTIAEEFQRPEMHTNSDTLKINLKNAMTTETNIKKVLTEKEQDNSTNTKNLELNEGQNLIYDRKIREQCNETNNVNYDKENLLKRGQEQAESKCINMHVAIYNKTHSNPNNFENNQITDANHVHLNEIDYFHAKLDAISSHHEENHAHETTQFENCTTKPLKLFTDNKTTLTQSSHEDNFAFKENLTTRRSTESEYPRENAMKTGFSPENKNSFEENSQIENGELLAKIDFDSNLDPEFEPELIAKIKLNSEEINEGFEYYQKFYGNDKENDDSSLDSEIQSMLSHNIQKINKAVILIQSVWRGFLVRRYQSGHKRVVHDSDQSGAVGFDLDDESNTDWRLPIKLREKLIQNEDRASSAPAAVVHDNDDDAGDVHIHVHVNSNNNIQDRSGGDDEVVFRVPNGVFVTEKDRHQQEAEAAIAGAAAVAAAVVIQRQYRQYRTLKITTTVTSSTILLRDTTNYQLHQQLQQLNKPLGLNKDLQLPGDLNIHPDTRNCDELKRYLEKSTRASHSEKKSTIFIDDISVGSENNEEGMKFIPVRNLIIMSNQQQLLDDDNQSSVHSAATKIQAGFRGYQVRKQMKQNKESLTNTGGVNNGNSGKGAPRKNSNSGRRKAPSAAAAPSLNSKSNSKNNNADDIEILEKSATKIQAGVRGFLVRKRKQKKQ